VDTTYNEEVYTTRLDRDRCGISEAEAARIAFEIERGNTSNPHLAEERGQAIDDGGVGCGQGVQGGAGGRRRLWPRGTRRLLRRRRGRPAASCCVRAAVRREA
jgi:hypothetical protein